MSDLVGNIQSSGGAAQLRSATTVSASKAASSYSYAAAAAASVETPDGITTVSPLATQYISDPVAGLVTQYMDSNGNVVNQVPSTLALTYLRAGLTADGMHRRNETPTSSVMA